MVIFIFYTKLLIVEWLTASPVQPPIASSVFTQKYSLNMHRNQFRHLFLHTSYNNVIVTVK